MEDGREDGGSSASDLYIIDNPPAQEGIIPSVISAAPANATGSRALTSTNNSDSDSDSDSSSEMDVAESDEEPEPEPKPTPPPQPEPHAAASATGAKRKLGDEATNGSSQTVHALPKKPRLSQSPTVPSATSHPSPQANGTESNGLTTQPTPALSAQPTNGSGAPAAMKLPTELWQRIFLFMPPTALGRCLSVCKTFNIYLTRTKAAPGSKKSKDTTESIRPVDSNELWSHARKIWVPNMPKVLAGYTELQTIQLVGGYSCQSCGKVPAPLTAPSAFEAGPGNHGVRVIWPFGIRTCGQCLEKNTVKDILLYKSENSVLAPGLPHALITQGLNFIPDSTMRQGGAPTNLGPVSKRFHQKDIARIKAEYMEAQEFGDAAAEEWKKGLITQGKNAMADAARWEKWEAQMPPGSDLSRALREYDVSSSTQAEAQRKSAARQPEAPTHVGNGPVPRHGSQFGLPPPPIQTMPPLHYSTGAPAAWHTGGPTWPPGFNPQYTAAQGRTNPREGDERNSDEQRRQAEERQNVRKKEIERRSAELDPELDPGLLAYMNSFKAAIQIPQPLTDQAWEMLRPRILQDKESAYAAREAAEAKAYEDAQRNAALNASRPSTNMDDSYLKPAKEIYDKDYERAQQPLRERLAEYVTEFVEQTYDGAPDLDRESSPAFAANAIVHAFRRYTEDKNAENLPVPPSHPKGREGSPPMDPFLSLDNMKWLFENKIKTYLPQVASLAIFLCAGCLEESPPTVKWLAFEGLMQHYASKHTSAFSQGNIIVHWQLSDWPEEPPFYTHPEEYARRRAPGHQGAGRPTPRPRRNGAFQAPGAANTHPRRNQESYSNGYNHGAHGYHPSYGQSNHIAPSGNSHGPSRASRSLPIEEEFDHEKIHQLTAVIRHVFNSLGGMSEKDLPNSVRVHTALKIANERFLDMYKFVPTLDHFTEAITSPGMEAIKNAGGLACKQCVDSQSDKSADDQGYFNKIQNARLFTLGAIINHFRIQHLPNLQWPIWMRDMILLPELKVVSKVVHAQNMDDDKLALLNIAFENAFPKPLPKLSVLRQFTSDADDVAGMVSKMMTRADQKSSKPSKKRKKGKQGGTGGPGGRDGSQELPTSEPQDHEYDPRKPMQAQQQDDDEEDLSKYDSDIVRKMPASSAAPAGASASNFGLAPETLQALQALGMSSSTPGAAAQPAPEVPAWHGSGRERAPSVGRDDRNVQPDIAAILASLGVPQQSQPPQPAPQPQQHSASPSAGDRRPKEELSNYGPHNSPESRSDRTYHPYQHQSAYGQQYSPSAPSPAYAPQAMTPQQWQASQQHAQYHQPTAEPPTPRQRYETPGSDLQAALERNAQHYALNQQAPPMYAHQAPQQYYAQPQQPTYAEPTHYYPPQEQHVAPPRYRYVYDDPGQGHGQHVQYLSAPPQQHQYAHAPPPPQHVVQRTVYVDEHGREIRMVPEQQYAPQGQGQGFWEYGQSPGGYGGQGYGGR